MGGGFRSADIQQFPWIAIFEEELLGERGDVTELFFYFDKRLGIFNIVPRWTSHWHLWMYTNVLWIYSPKTMSFRPPLSLKAIVGVTQT